MNLRTGLAMAILALASFFAFPWNTAAATPGPASTKPERATTTNLDQMAKTIFPDDGVLLAVSLKTFQPIRMGNLGGCEIRLHVDRVLRLEAGKEQFVIKGNPMTLEQTLGLLTANNANRVLLYSRRHTADEAAAMDEDKRLNDLLKMDHPYLLVLPSAIQLSPVLPLPVGNMPWAQIDEHEQGLLILDFDEASVRGLPARMKAVRGWISDLSAADRKQQSEAMEGLVRNRDLAERLLVRELTKAKGAALRAVALTLAEMGSPAATETLAAIIRADDPAAAREAIVALRKIKGLQVAGVAALITRLGDDRRQGEGDAAFVLSDDAAKTLEQTTGQKFGKDKATWEKWLEKVSQPTNDSLPGGAGGGRPTDKPN